MAISFPQIGLEATSTVSRVALRPDLGFMSAASVMHSDPCEPAQQDASDSVVLTYSSVLKQRRRGSLQRCRDLPSHPQLYDRALQQVLPHEGIGRDEALRRLERIGLEADQPARSIGERRAKVLGQC